MQEIIHFTERVMGMSDGVWARHANPLSVWTRFSCLPLLVLAIWSRDWIGLWCLFPVALALFWIWYNPRAFPPPENTDNWASKGTFGERVYLNRAKIPIPKHHEVAANILAALSVPGLALLIYGLYAPDPLATVTGTFGTILPKVWFVDRMVWLYENMKDESEKYQSWLR